MDEGEVQNHISFSPTNNGVYTIPAAYQTDGKVVATISGLPGKVSDIEYKYKAVRCDSNGNPAGPQNLICDVHSVNGESVNVTVSVPSSDTNGNVSFKLKRSTEPYEVVNFPSAGAVRQLTKINGNYGTDTINDLPELSASDGNYTYEVKRTDSFGTLINKNNLTTTGTASSITVSVTNSSIETGPVHYVIIRKTQNMNAEDSDVTNGGNAVVNDQYGLVTFRLNNVLNTFTLRLNKVFGKKYTTDNTDHYETLKGKEFDQFFNENFISTLKFKIQRKLQNYSTWEDYDYNFGAADSSNKGILTGNDLIRDAANDRYYYDFKYLPKYKPTNSLSTTSKPYQYRIIELNNWTTESTTGTEQHVWNYYPQNKNDIGSTRTNESDALVITPEKNSSRLDTYVRNVFETKEITLSKFWDDDNNADGLRPETLPIYLYEYVPNDNITKPYLLPPTGHNPIIITDELKSSDSDSWNKKVRLSKFFFNGEEPIGNLAYTIREEELTKVFRRTGGTDEEPTYDAKSSSAYGYKLSDYGYLIKENNTTVPKSSAIPENNFGDAYAAGGTINLGDSTTPDNHTTESRDGTPSNPSTDNNISSADFVGLYLKNTKTRINSKLTFEKSWEDFDNKWSLRPSNIYVKILRVKESDLDEHGNLKTGASREVVKYQYDGTASSDKLIAPKVNNTPCSVDSATGVITIARTPQSTNTNKDVDMVVEHLAYGVNSTGTEQNNGTFVKYLYTVVECDEFGNDVNAPMTYVDIITTTGDQQAIAKSLEFNIGTVTDANGKSYFHIYVKNENTGSPVTEDVYGNPIKVTITYQNGTNTYTEEYFAPSTSHTGIVKPGVIVVPINTDTNVQILSAVISDLPFGTMNSDGTCSQKNTYKITQCNTKYEQRSGVDLIAGSKTVNGSELTPITTSQYVYKNTVLTYNKKWGDDSVDLKLRPENVYFKLYRSYEGETNEEQVTTFSVTKGTVNNGILTVPVNDSNLTENELTDTISGLPSGTFVGNVWKKYNYRLSECDSTGTVTLDKHRTYSWKHDDSSVDQPFIIESDTNNKYSKAKLNEGATNKLVTTEHDVTTIWDNVEEGDKKPYNVQIQYRSDEKSTWSVLDELALKNITYYGSDNTGSKVTSIATDGTITLAKDKLKIFIDSLPQYDINGKKYQYRAVETKIGGYSVTDNTRYMYQIPIGTYSQTSYISRYYRGIKNMYVRYNHDIMLYDFDSKSSVITNSPALNTIAYVHVIARKTWDDEDNLYGKRPSEVTFTLKRAIRTVTQTFDPSYPNDPEHATISETITKDNSFSSPLLANENNNWSVTWYHCISVDEQGNDYIYYVLEDDLSGKNYSMTEGVKSKETEPFYEYVGNPESITTEIENQLTKVFTFTNQYTPDKVKLTVLKDWNDQNNKFKLRPDSVTFELWCRYDIYDYERDKNDDPVKDSNGNVQPPQRVTYSANSGGSYIKYASIADYLKGDNSGNLIYEGPVYYSVNNVDSAVNAVYASIKTANASVSASDLKPTLTLDNNKLKTSESPLTYDENKWSVDFKYLPAWVNTAGDGTYAGKSVPVTYYVKEKFYDSSDSDITNKVKKTYLCADAGDSCTSSEVTLIDSTGDNAKARTDVGGVGTTDNDDTDDGLKITNTLDTRDIIVTKTWDDNGCTEPNVTTLHYNVKLTMTATGLVYDSSTFSRDGYIQANEASSKVLRYSNLPMYDKNGDVISYHITEERTDSIGTYGTDVSSVDGSAVTTGTENNTVFTQSTESGKNAKYGYKATCKITSFNGYITRFDITNKLPVTSVTVTKNWVDAFGNGPIQNYYNLRPDTIGLQLYRTTADSLAVDAETSDNKDDESSKWITVDCNGDTDGTKKTEDTDKTTASKDYAYVNLLRYSENNTEYQFMVKEDTVNAYDTTYTIGVTSTGESKTLNVTNTLKFRDIYVAKKWVDNGCATASSLHYNVKVTLSSSVATGGNNSQTTYSSSQVIPADASKVAKFVNLPIYDATGRIITYHVAEEATEDAVDAADTASFDDSGSATDSSEFTAPTNAQRKYGYIGTCTKTVHTDGYVTQYNITNTLPLTTVNVTKQWADEFSSTQNYYKLRPDSIALTLYRSVKSVSSYETPSTDWTQVGTTQTFTGQQNNVASVTNMKFENLLRYDAENKEFKFEVVEDHVNGYKTEYSYSGNTGVTLTDNSDTNPVTRQLELKNTLDTRDIVVTKAWNDNGYGGNEGIDKAKALHYNIKVTLSNPSLRIGGSGTYLESKVLPKDSTNVLKFEHLPKYDKNGAEILYSIKEQYDSSSINDSVSAPTGFTDDAETDLAIGITFIYNAANDDYRYGYVGSCKMGKETDNSITGSGLANTYVTKYKITNTLPLSAVKVEKHWDDQSNEFGLRPSAIVDRNTVSSMTDNDKLYLTLKRKISSDSNYDNIDPNGAVSGHETESYTAVSDLNVGTNEWTYTYTKLLKCDVNNNNYEFEITEQKLKAYESPKYCAKANYDSGTPSTQTLTGSDVDTLANSQTVWNGYNVLGKSMEITNKLDTRDIVVALKWNDNGYTGGQYVTDDSTKVTQNYDPHYNVKLTLSSTVSASTRNSGSTYSEYQIIPTTKGGAVTNGYGVTFYNLPKYDKSGNAISYTVREDATTDVERVAVTGKYNQAEANKFHENQTDVTSGMFTMGDKHYNYGGSTQYEEDADHILTQYNILNTLPITNIDVSVFWKDDEAYHKYATNDINRRITYTITRTNGYKNGNTQDCEYGYSKKYITDYTADTVTYSAADNNLTNQLAFNYDNEKYEYKIEEDHVTGYTTDYPNAANTSGTDNTWQTKNAVVSDTTEMHIRNTQITDSIVYHKVDEDYHNLYSDTAKYKSSEIYLPGAQFRLYIKDSSSNEIPVPVDLVSGQTYYEYNINNAVGTDCNLITVQAGGIINLRGLPLNTYYLKEVGIVSGYKQNNNEYSFTLDVDASNTPQTPTRTGGSLGGDLIGNEEKRSTLKLVKTDEENERKKLSLATYYLLRRIPFDVNKKDTLKAGGETAYNTAAQNVVVNYNGTFSSVLDYWEIVDTKQTDDHGVILENNLPFGTYYFFEVQAPVGYDCDYDGLLPKTINASEVGNNIENYTYSMDYAGSETSHREPRRNASVKVFKSDENGDGLNGAEFELYYSPDAQQTNVRPDLPTSVTPRSDHDYIYFTDSDDNGDRWVAGTIRSNDSTSSPFKGKFDKTNSNDQIYAVFYDSSKNEISGWEWDDNRTLWERYIDSYGDIVYKVEPPEGAAYVRFHSSADGSNHVKQTEALPVKIGYGYKKTTFKENDTYGNSVYNAKEWRLSTNDVSGDDNSVTPTESFEYSDNKLIIRLDSNYDWDDLHIYFWHRDANNVDTTVGQSYPGYLMEDYGKSDGNSGTATNPTYNPARLQFEISIPNGATHFMLDNGSKEASSNKYYVTEDYAINTNSSYRNNGNYWKFGNNGEPNSSNKFVLVNWDNMPEAVPTSGLSDYDYVFFNCANVTSWVDGNHPKIYAHFYKIEGSVNVPYTEWPGVPADSSYVNEIGQTVYKFIVPAGYDKVVFNNGIYQESETTSIDIKRTQNIGWLSSLNGKGFYLKEESEKDGNGYYYVNVWGTSQASSATQSYTPVVSIDPIDSYLYIIDPNDTYDDLHVEFFDSSQNRVSGQASPGYIPQYFGTETENTETNGTWYKISIPNDAASFQINNGKHSSVVRQSVIKTISEGGIYRIENTQIGSEQNITTVYPVTAPFAPQSTDVLVATITTGDDGLNSTVTILDSTYASLAADNKGIVLNNWGYYYYKETKPPTGYKLPTGENQYYPFIVDNAVADEVVHITNVSDEKNKGSVLIHKISSEALGSNIPGTKLTGAKFKLYKWNDDLSAATPPSPITFTGSAGIYTYDDTTPGTVTELETNSNGKLQLNLLPWGMYKLVEIAAPTNYKLDSEPVYFTIGRNTADLTGNSVPNVYVKNEVNKATLKIDKEITELRAAWGDPTFIFKVKQTKDYDSNSVTNGNEYTLSLTLTANDFDNGDSKYKNYTSIDLEPGEYEVTEIQVARYGCSSITNVSGTVSVDGTTKATVTLTAGGSAEVKFTNNVEYYDKFSQVESKVNEFNGVKALSVAYNQTIEVAENVTPNEALTTPINKNDLAKALILSSGKELSGHTFDYSKLKISKTTTLPGDTRFNVSDSGGNSFTVTYEPAIAAGYVYKLQAKYTYGGKDFTTTFDLAFTQRHETKKLTKKTVTFRVDDSNQSYFNDGGTHTSTMTYTYYILTDSNNNKTIQAVMHNGTEVTMGTSYQATILSNVNNAFKVLDVYTPMYNKWTSGTAGVTTDNLDQKLRDTDADNIVFTATLSTSTP